MNILGTHALAQTLLITSNERILLTPFDAFTTWGMQQVSPPVHKIRNCHQKLVSLWIPMKSVIHGVILKSEAAAAVPITKPATNILVLVFRSHYWVSDS